MRRKWTSDAWLDAYMELQDDIANRVYDWKHRAINDQDLCKQLALAGQKFVDNLTSGK